MNLSHGPTGVRKFDVYSAEAIEKQKEYVVRTGVASIPVHLKINGDGGSIYEDGSVFENKHGDTWPTYPPLTIHPGDGIVLLETGLDGSLFDVQINGARYCLSRSDLKEMEVEE